MLDEVKGLHSLWVTSINLIISSLKLGFTDKIIQGLLNELHKLCISQQPIRSAKRVLSRMRKVVEEIELDESIRRRSSELKALDERFAEFDAEMNMLEKRVLGTLSTVEGKAEENIGQLVNSYLHQLNITGNQALINQENLQLKISESIEGYQKRIDSGFTSNYFMMQAALKFFSEEIQEWGRVKEKAGILQAEINLAAILFGFNSDQQALINLSPTIICKLSEKIYYYVTLRWPDVQTKAPDKIAAMDIGISSFYMAKMSNVAYWLLDAIRNMERSTSR